MEGEKKKCVCLGPAAGDGPKSGVILSNGSVHVTTVSLCGCSPSKLSKKRGGKILYEFYLMAPLHNVSELEL